MSKTMEAYLLDVIVDTLDKHVKQVAEALEGHTLDFEGLIEVLRRASQACFSRVLAACIESRRAQAERNVQCPHCGGRARNKGPQKRQLVTPVGRMTWTRRYFYCEHCRRGWFPLDDVWGIGAGQFSVDHQAGMALLGANLSFEKAAQVFALLTGEAVSDREVARTTEECGADVEARRQEEQRHWLEREPQPDQPSTEQAWGVGLDAAKVHFRDGWHEVKVGVVVELGAHEQGPRALRGKSYAVEVGTMEQAGQRLYAEALRRGVDPWRDPVICLADGAPSNWSQFAAYFDRRVEILDWHHATEHLWAAARGI